MFKFLLFLLAIYLIFKFVVQFIFGTTRRARTNNPFDRQSQQRQPEKEEPETQEERILDYQKKNFEASDAVDVDFEETKNDE